jgi:hypothetical protein
MWLETVTKMAKQNKDVQFVPYGNIEEISTSTIKVVTCPSRKNGWGYIKIAIPNELAQRLLTKQDMKGGLLLFDSAEFSAIEKEDCPTIDAVPVVRGEWTTNSDYPDTVICSLCGWREDVWWADKGTNYCPNCGVKMEIEP